MKDDFINEVCMSMSVFMDSDNLAYLKTIMCAKLDKYDLTLKKNEIVEYIDNKKYIEMFLVSKKIDGLSDRTLQLYGHTLRRYLNFYINKMVGDFTKEDLRIHFAKRMIDNPNLSKVTINNERRVFSSFFGWLFINSYIKSNPMIAVKNIKEDKVIKYPFTELEIEQMRDYFVKQVSNTKKAKHLAALRNLAIFEFLLSTGCRVSELTGAKLSNLDVAGREITVFGKGSKERICYLNVLSSKRIMEYLETRGKDDNEYLFAPVEYKDKNGQKPLDKSYVECIIRKAGNELNIKAHPHKFRRTCATMLLNKGMPIEQVQMILGHNQLDTTLIYAQTNRRTVKINHEKYM